jgi:hypothetical protein
MSSIKAFHFPQQRRCCFEKDHRRKTDLQCKICELMNTVFKYSKLPGTALVISTGVLSLETSSILQKLQERYSQ